MKKIILMVISQVVFLMFTSCNGNGKEKINAAEQYNRYSYVSMGEGYIFWGENNLPTYLDYETMKTTMLCSLPNCTHTTQSCIEVLFDQNALLPIIYNDCAYYFINSRNFVEENEKIILDLKSSLMKYNFLDMKTEKIAEVDDCNVNVRSGGYLIDSSYYFTTNNGNPKYDELGSVIASSEHGGGNLMSINLVNGKVTDYGNFFDYEELKKQYPAADSSTSFDIEGKHGDELYIDVSYQKERPSREYLEQGVGESPPFYGDTYTFNLKTKEIKKIFDNKLLLTMNGYYAYCYCDDGKGSTMMIQNLDTGKTIEMENCFYSRFSIHNNKIWGDSIGIDIESGQKVTFTDLESANVIAVYKDNYIIKGYDNDMNTIFHKIPCEEIDKLFE